MFKRNPRNINSLTVRTKKVSLHKPKLKTPSGMTLGTVDTHDTLTHQEHKVDFKETFIDKIVDKFGVVPILFGFITLLLILIAVGSTVAKTNNVENVNQHQTQSKVLKISNPDQGA